MNENFKVHDLVRLKTEFIVFGTIIDLREDGSCTIEKFWEDETIVESHIDELATIRETR